MDGHATETTLPTSVPARGKLEPPLDTGAYSRHVPASGETRPTNEEPVSAPIDGTGPGGLLCASVRTNPTGTSAPSGPEPVNSPGVHGDSSKLLRGGSPMAPPRDISQLQELFPWTASLPERLQQGLLWDPSVAPYEVQTPGQLLLYTGKADSQSLDSVLLSLQSHLEGHIIALDIRRSEDHDILRGDLYAQLCVSAWNGYLQGTGGGPNCRTWSILRWFPKPGFPKPRGRQLQSQRAT